MKAVNVAFLASVLAPSSVIAGSQTRDQPSPGPTGSTYPTGFDMTTSWGNLSPYKPATAFGGFGLPQGVPKGCELSQVHVLHRHAQRYPTNFGDGAVMHDFAYKVGNYTAKHKNSPVGTGPLEFLNHWQYSMGTDLLLVNGAATEATSGAWFWSKYGNLLYRAPPGVPSYTPDLNTYPNGTARPTPVFRTTSQARILESARWWLSGFFGNAGANSSYDLYDLVIIPEVEPFNNTLASYDACPGDESEGDKSDLIFGAKYTQAALKRLSAHLPKGFNLTALDVYGMQNLCAYEYALFSGSAFCSLFTEEEWSAFEYMLDIQYYGDYGFGSPTGRAHGVGYVQELAARLENTLIYSSDTSINYTYDDNTKQFPLGQPFYMDMSHDDTIVGVTTALGLDYFKFSDHGLPANVSSPPASRNFRLNKMTPFGARFVSEVWTCPANDSSVFTDLTPVIYKNPDLSEAKGTARYIRFVLNDAPVPVDGIKACENAVNGFCAVKDFLKDVPHMVKESDYQRACFANYTVSGQVGNGQPPSEE
ncbi:putative extracellular phytase [Talaromyces proteolyticus]|uniref:Extracellular phytase n=1 Tax=Talaromyces proteolyticus TaxID=1131652 RepID=A0AAD4KIR0_9EURO|nr:putative extracellular phytase [Talaromyces proteolyticus]KAH8689450.1 putative extracellular phytase [Talaromyces proteolyticus]